MTRRDIQEGLSIYSIYPTYPNSYFDDTSLARRVNHGPCGPCAPFYLVPGYPVPSHVPLSYATMTQGHTSMNETTTNTQSINKGIFPRPVTIVPLADGSFVYNNGSFNSQGFTSIDDVLNFLKLEAKKFSAGLDAEAEAKVAAAKKKSS